MEWLCKGSIVKVYDNATGQVRKARLTDIALAMIDDTIKVRIDYRHIDDAGNECLEGRIAVMAEELYELIGFAEQLDAVFDSSPKLRYKLSGIEVTCLEQYTMLTLSESICPNKCTAVVEARPNGAVFCTYCRNLLIGKVLDLSDSEKA